MGMIRNALTFGKKIFKIGKDNAPVVFQVVSSTSTVLAVIFSAKAAPKAVELIEEAEKAKGEELTFPEKVGATWKVWILPAAATGLSVASGWGSLHSSAKQNATLAGAVASAELALTEYQQKTKEVVGEKKEREIRDEIAKDQAEKIVQNNPDPYPTGLGEDTFVDTYTGTHFKSTQGVIDRACNTIADRIINGFEMFVDLNELRFEMNLGEVDVGRNVYFTRDNLPKYVYTHIPGEPYVSISFAPGHEPKLDIKALYSGI